jgi:predicted NBD/HSP70 family sugar kinase
MKEKTSILGSNHQSTKIQNRALVLKMICTGVNVSRIDISRQTGLSKMSITNIVTELINEGFVVDQAEKAELSNNASVGRKPIFLAPDTSTFMALGIYISRDFAVATLSNLKCEIIYEMKCSFSFEESESSFTYKIKALVSSILNTDMASEKKVIGIGVACIGPLDIENGVILEPPNFHNLRSISIKRLLEKEFGYKVFIDNDMNASALAEKLYGKARDINNFVYIGVTNGIGAGIITNGVLFAGDMGFSGEIGHITINYEGPKCVCGNTGCLELYASIPEIVSQAKNSIALGMDSTLRELETIEWKDIVKYADLGDKLALNLIDRLCLYISIGLVSLTNIFDPKIIYLGHDIALAGSLVTVRLESFLKDKTISSRYKSVPIEISAFGDKAPIAGSAAIVFNRLFNGF